MEWINSSTDRVFNKEQRWMCYTSTYYFDIGIQKNTE